MEGGAFHARHELDDADFAYIHDESVDDLVAEFAMGHLASAETERCFDLVAIAEEADSLVLLGLVVVLVYRDGELDFLDDDDLLLLACGAFGLVLLVKVLAIVLNAADGRDSIGRNLYEVEATFTGDFECVERGHDAHLFAIFVDDANLACANLFVGTDEALLRTFVGKRWNKT